jgi:hypothetical protein
MGVDRVRARKSAMRRAPDFDFGAPRSNVDRSPGDHRTAGLGSDDLDAAFPVKAAI